MYEETKHAVRKAFEVCGLLYSLGNKYNDLKKVIEKINRPTEKEVKHLVSSTINMEKAIVLELRERYKRAAIEVGLHEKYGIALLEYISLLEEMKE